MDCKASASLVASAVQAAAGLQQVQIQLAADTGKGLPTLLKTETRPCWLQKPGTHLTLMAKKGHELHSLSRQCLEEMKQSLFKTERERQRERERATQGGA